MIIALVFDSKKPRAVKLVQEVKKTLSSRGHKIFCRLNRANISKVQMVITFGGDGLVMNVANQVVDYEIPILRINFGNIGFLNNIEPEDAMKKILDAVENQNYIIVKKTRLEAFLMDRDELHPENNYVKKAEALNDIVIERIDSKIVTLSATIDGHRPPHIFRGDGLIICSKTGSTAYNMSAGGRTLFKENELGLKVISPTGGEFPDQIKKDGESKFEIRLTSGKARLVADDKSFGAIQESQKVLIRKSPKNTLFIEVGDKARID